MSEVDIDLWPSTFETPQTEFPDTILKEQATRLGEKTNHLVEATVSFPEHAKYLSDKIRLAFYLVAPRLGNYSYRLFTVEYQITSTGEGITGYPVTLLNDEERVCKDREQFMNALREVFGSQSTVRIISSLMTD